MTTPAIEFKEVNPILPVRNIEAALFFYTDQLGFELSFRDCSAPNDYVGVRRGSVEIHLQRQSEENIPAPGSLMIRIVVDDPDALHGEYDARGALTPDTHPVSDKPWGTREFALCDPNGHGIVFYRDC